MSSSSLSSDICIFRFLPLRFCSRPVLDVGSDILELREDLGEEGRFRVDPEHGAAQLVDDADTPVPELVLVRLHQERLQRVAYLVAHVTIRIGKTRKERKSNLKIHSNIYEHE